MPEEEKAQVRELKTVKEKKGDGDGWANIVVAHEGRWRGFMTMGLVSLSP